MALRKFPYLIAALLALGACTPEPDANRPPVPLGIRQPLHPGFWQGPMGGTLIDFHIDQVSPTQVSVHISGTVIHPAVKDAQSYFYDRPKVCPVSRDHLSFDCPHYTEMHIDNGLLCGVYTINSVVYRPCFQLIR